jgi:hypothetical protein
MSTIFKTGMTGWPLRSDGIFSGWPGMGLSLIEQING